MQTPESSPSKMSASQVRVEQRMTEIAAQNGESIVKLAEKVRAPITAEMAT